MRSGRADTVAAHHRYWGETVIGEARTAEERGCVSVDLPERAVIDDFRWSIVGAELARFV
jgi:hypothetical protein